MTQYTVKEIIRKNTKYFVKDKKGARWSYSFIKSLAINASRIPHASIQFEWVTNIFFITHKISNTMLEIGWNKGSLQSFPRPLSSSAVVSRLLHKNKITRGLGNTEKAPQKITCTFNYSTGLPTLQLHMHWNNF